MSRMNPLARLKMVPLVYARCRRLEVNSYVGAGILALPVKTGLGGFIPSLLGMAVVGVAG